MVQQESGIRNPRRPDDVSHVDVSRHFFDLSIAKGSPFVLGTNGFLHHALKLRIDLDALKFFFEELVAVGRVMPRSFDMLYPIMQTAQSRAPDSSLLAPDF